MSAANAVLFALLSTGLLAAGASAQAPQQLPDVPACRGALTKTVVTRVKAAKQDPAVAYAKTHRRKPPVSVRCASALWHELHDTKTAPRPASLETGARPTDARFPDVPYAGPPPSSIAQPVRTQPLRKMPIIPPPLRGEGTAERDEPIRPQRPTDAPPADLLTTQRTMGELGSAPASTGVSFEGIGTGLTGFSPCCVPPDVNGHVGATQYVQWNNLSFAIWDKSGNRLYGPAAGYTLFQPLGGVCASHNDGDPLVSYDILAGRWILTQFVIRATPSYSHQCVAVSATSDATGAYYLYDFVTDPVNMVDYPHIGVWPDGYYMSAHIFNASGSAFVAGRVYVFEREKMLLGQPARVLSADLKQYGGKPQYGFVPAHLESITAPPPGEAEFVIGPDPATTTMLDSTRVAVTWGASPSLSLTETQINTPWGVPPCIYGGRACVPQPSPATSSEYLDNVDQTVMYRLGYRNFGGAPVQESIVGNITVAGSTSTPAHGALRWFELRNAGSSSATPTVYQAATFDPDNDYRWLGAISMDKDHDIALGYSKSSLTSPPSIWVNGRLGTDPLNTLGSETLVKAGPGVQYSVNRWGDYSSMSLDPIDQCTFWYTNEYLPSNGYYNWATRIASFKFPSCSPTVWGSITGTITTCDTGAPMSGVIVSLDNGFSGATDAAGHYTIAAPAGTYAISAAAADRSCSSSSPATVSVVVSTDATVTQDFCMNGTPVLDVKSVAVSDAANGNGNGIIDRNECTDLNVTLANDGCANASAIQATLTTSTTGVTVLQGSSFFPNMAVDGTGTTSVPFRIQTADSFLCGTTIQFTLNLTYAGGSKSMPFTAPSCTTNATRPIPTSSLTLSDPVQGDRLFRTGDPSTCSGKTCPAGFAGGNYNYKVFPFTNAGGATCVTVTINSFCQATEIESVAYLGSTYDPPAFGGDPKVCNNYLGDAGSSAGATYPSVSYSFNVPAQSSFVVVVNMVSPGTTCAQFSGTVAGLPANTSGSGPCPACTPPPTPSISASGATTFCSGGSVTLTSSAASGNQWYRDGAVLSGATGTTYVATTSGSYTVTAAAGGCTSAPSAATSVTAKPAPATPSATNGGPYCAGATIALFTPSVAGATYAWTGPNGFASALQNPTRVNATAADAGAYSVTVTANGCTSPAGTTNVAVTALPATPAASNGGPYCTGQTIALSAPSVSGAAYAWIGPNGFTSTLQNPTRANATAADAGTYWLTVTVNGCTSAGGPTDVVVSSIPSTPTASNGGPYCAGGTIALSTPSVSGATYAWTGPNGFTSSLQNPSRASAAAADAGTYSVTVTVNGCASAAGTTNVVVNTAVPATPAASNSGPFCEGGTIALSTPSLSGATYAWTGPNGFTSTLQNPTRPNATAADAGTYSVTVTVGGCTSAAGSTSVAVTAKPATPSPTNGGPYCEGSTIALFTPAVGGATYAWTGPNGFTSTLQNPTRANAAAADFGTYSVNVTANGCTSATGTTTVIDGNAPAVATNDGPYCVGGTIALSTPTVSGATYAWTGPNGFTSALQNPTIANAAAADAGTYSVVVTSPGCTSQSGSTTVVVNSVPATPAASNGGPYCEGATLALSTPAVAGATYSWTGPNGFTSTLQNPTRAGLTQADAGTYSVTIFNGCTSSAGSTTVAVNPVPAAPAASNGGPVCIGGTISLSTPAVGGATYAWTGPNGFTSALQNPTRANAAAADAGTYSVTVTVNGCTSPAGTTNVAVNTVATPAASNGGPYCEGATISLSTPAVTGATYAWTGPNGFTSTSRTPVRTGAGAADAGTYSVTVTVNGCTSPAGSTNVVIHSLPATPVASNSGPYCAGGTISLSTPAVAGAAYAWTGPNGFASTLQNPTRANATSADAGVYSLSITVNGCTSTLGTTTVVVRPLPATPSASNTGPYCAGSTISLSTPAVTGATYAWTGPGGFTSTQRTPIRANATTADSGAYSVTVTANGCTSAAGTTNVTVNSIPATPAATNGGPYCAGATIALFAPAVAGATYAWTGPGGFTSSLQNPTRASATAAFAGTYTVTVTVNGCTSAGATTVTVNTPVIPTISASGATTFCAGGSVTLTSSGATAYQWSLNGSDIPGATAVSYVATATGSYTVRTTTNGCSATSAARTVTAKPIPSAAITALATMSPNAAATASVADAGANAAYVWTISNGTVTSGLGTRTIAFTAGASGAVTLNVQVSLSGCSEAKSATVAILPHVTAVSPAVGRTSGGTSVTITGNGFQSGASVRLGGTAATGVVRVNSTTLTATLPAHAAGVVSVLVTNPDTNDSTLANGFTYLSQVFDPNNDHTVDPSDIFYLINYLFLNGPPPAGQAGMSSGDANGDGSVDPADIFFLINYFFQKGPAPQSLQPITASVRLGEPVARDGHLFVPVIVESGPAKPHALSLRLRVRGGTVVAVHRTGDLPPLFEATRTTADGIAWLVSLGENALSGTVAELELTGPADLELDPMLTVLTDETGTQKASVTNGRLRLEHRR